MKSTDNLNEQMQAVSNDLATLAKDARALLAATADVARGQAIERAKGLDEIVRENPYQAIGIALGVGALIGILAARQRSRSD